jgi:hypothetical protein
MFERATAPDVRDPAAMVHEYLKQRCAWDFGRSVKIDTKLEGVSAAPGHDQTPDEFVEDALARFNFAPFPELYSEQDEQRIRVQLKKTGAAEKLWSPLELSQWALLYLWTREIRLNDERIRPEHWDAVGLPKGQSARYERMNKLIKMIQEGVFTVSRDSLATSFKNAKDVDPLDVQTACEILIQDIFVRAEEQNFPENFRDAVFSAVEQQP